MAVSIKQSNYMRNSTNVYYFFINSETDLTADSTIEIEFLSDSWSLHSASAVSGFIDGPNLASEVIGNKIVIYDFGGANHTKQQVLGLNLTSFVSEGTYPVSVRTKISDHQIGYWEG